MGEVITLHIGQAGINIGTSFWEELIRETSKQMVEAEKSSLPQQLGESEQQAFKLLPNNKKKPKVRHHTQIVQPKTVKGLTDHERPHAFFHEISNGTLVPRAVFVDRGPDPIEQVMSSRIGGCFSQTGSFVYDSTQTGGVCLESYYETQIITDAMEAVRKQAEATDSLSALMLTFGIAGGTGSGIMMRIADRFRDALGKKATKVSFTVYPSIGSQEISTESYNSALVHKELIEEIDMVAILDNKAIHNHLYYHKGIDSPQMTDVNSVIAQLMSNITASMRFSNSCNNNLDAIASGLVMYPRIKFLTTSLLDSTLVSPGLAACPAELTSQILQPYACLAGTLPTSDKLLSTYLSFRGDVPQSQAILAAQLMRSQNQFVGHSPTPVKLDVVRQLPAYAAPNTLVLSALTSSTAVGPYLQKIMDRRSALWDRRRIFAHLYNSWKGSEMNEQMESLVSLIKDYEEVGVETAQGDNQDENDDM